MTKYLLIVNFEGGAVQEPMEEWKLEEITAHLDYYRRLNEQLTASGELVGGALLSGPDVAKVVTSDGATPVVTDGPFTEFKEWVAGYQIIDVETEQRAIEIAAQVSAVPGPGGRPTQQPIQLRRVMEQGPGSADAMMDYLSTADGQP
ncbi:YciI family protein [Microlunatus sp. GCM10028923]|uniref:YciI family protein n=1 Tax=Microlunatus sp. GCM10028923 TaxID=3273400 RepID=UPI00360D6CBB